MIKKILSSLLILSAMPLMAYAYAATDATTDASASKPIMELTVGKIVLYPDRMGMTGSESLMECLQSIPALVQKGGVDLLDNYTLEENDNTYLQDPTIYLEQTRISEVDHIEITTDGSVTSGLSGVMGIINVILKTPKEGTHGHVDLMGNSHGEIYPTIYLSHRKGIFSAIGSVMGLLDRTKSDAYSYQSDMLQEHDHLYTRHRDESMKMHLEWALPKDDFLLKISQYYGKDKNRDSYTSYVDETDDQTISTGTAHSRKLNASLDYEHDFSAKTVLKASVAVETVNDDSQTSNYFSDVNADDYGKVNSMDDMYANTTVWSTNIKLEKWVGDWFFVKAAVPMSWKHVDNNFYQLVQLQGDEQTLYKQTLASNLGSYNPYLVVEMHLGKQWFLSVGARETISHYSLSQSEYDPWSTTKSATIYSGTLEYHPKQNHTLQAAYRHTVGMPSMAQLYPNLWFSKSPNIFYQGDESLRHTAYDIWNVKYALSLPKLQLCVSAQYYTCNDDIISQAVGSFGNMVAWKSSNTDRVNMVNLNASAVWICGPLQVMGGASWYNKHDQDNHFDTSWLCLRLVPTLQLPYQFTLSAQCSYVSPQKNETLDMDKAWYGLVRVTKRWNCGISAFVYWENFLQRYSVNYTRTLPVVKTSTDVHENKISFGISYDFL